MGSSDAPVPVAFCMPRRHRHTELHCFRHSIPRLYAPLSTLRVLPRGSIPRMTRGLGMKEAPALLVEFGFDSHPAIAALRLLRARYTAGKARRQRRRCRHVRLPMVDRDGFTNPAAILAGRAFMPHLRHPLVIPATPPTPLHTLLLHGLLPLEQEAPVDIAIQVPSPGCRRQALGSGLIGAVAGVAELPTHDAPRVIMRDGRGGAGDGGRPGR